MLYIHLIFTPTLSLLVPGYIGAVVGSGAGHSGDRPGQEHRGGGHIEPGTVKHPHPLSADVPSV